MINRTNYNYLNNCNRLKIYVFGNPLVKEDSLPIKLLPDLQKAFPKIEFIVIDPNENFPPSGEKDLTILDTVIGIKKPTILNLDDFGSKGKTPISPHDYDLLFHLLLLIKLKKIYSVKIIGLPQVKTAGVIEKIKNLIDILQP